MKDKRFIVKWKRQEEWKDVFETDSFEDAMDFATNRISRTHITERIEIHEHNECLRTVYDHGWSSS